jgi:hypothetical protein
VRPTQSPSKKDYWTFAPLEEGDKWRNASAQRENIMSCVGAARQPSAPHVSHAEIGGWQVFFRFKIRDRHARPDCV